MNSILYVVVRFKLESHYSLAEKHPSARLLVVVSILMLVIITIPDVYSIESTVQNKALAFLSDVVGLDIAKYNVKVEGPTVNYNSVFGPSVKEENILFILNFDGKQTRADFVFENGLLAYCHLSYINGSAIYKYSPSESVLEQAKTHPKISELRRSKLRSRQFTCSINVEDARQCF